MKDSKKKCIEEKGCTAQLRKNKYIYKYLCMWEKERMLLPIISMLPKFPFCGYKMRCQAILSEMINYFFLIINKMSKSNKYDHTTDYFIYLISIASIINIKSKSNGFKLLLIIYLS